MNIILLAGGSGQLLWPLSNGVRSKQFIRVFRTPDGGRESMLQRVWRKIREAEPDASVTVATSAAQVSAVRRQLGQQARVCPEPCRRDTFPAIVLAAAHLHDVQGVGPDEAAVVCPVDPYIRDGYPDALRRMWELAQSDAAPLVLMGVRPACPGENYGYILPETGDEVSRVLSFREKPDEKTAREYIASGGLWNGGVFAFKLRWALEKARERTGFDRYDDLLANYETLEKISFDYAVTEREKDALVFRFSGEWKDLGTWNTLTEAMEENPVGDVRFDGACQNVQAVNELDIPMLVLGIRDAVVAASPEGILVSSRERSGCIKPLVDEIDRPVMFAEKSWGSYRVLSAEEDSLTVQLTLDPGRGMSCHSHQNRDEVWTVISGTGLAAVDGKERTVRPGDTVFLPAGSRHTIAAGKEGVLRLIEVQLGRNIDAGDKRIHRPGPGKAEDETVNGVEDENV